MNSEQIGECERLTQLLPAFTLTKRGNGDFIAMWIDYTNGRTIERTSRSNPTTALRRLANALYDAGILMVPIP